MLPASVSDSEGSDPSSSPQETSLCCTDEHLLAWQRLAAQGECYPERNAWYQEAIEMLVRPLASPSNETNATPVLVRFSSESGIAAWVSCCFFQKGIPHEMQVEAATLDAAWEGLYAEVYVLLSSPSAASRETSTTAANRVSHE